MDWRLFLFSYDDWSQLMYFKILKFFEKMVTMFQFMFLKMIR